MANFSFNEIKRALFEGEMDFNATDDLRIVLAMVLTTFDTEYDINTLTAVTTPDYCDGANHDATNGHALAGEAVTETAGVSGSADLDATDLVISALGVGTGQNEGHVLFKWVTNIGASIPIAWVDTGGYNFDGNGGDVTFQWNALGILQLS